MFYIIIGSLIIAFFVIIECFCTKDIGDRLKYAGYGIVSAVVIGAFSFIISAYVIEFFVGRHDMPTEVYQLKEQHDNQFYTVSTSGNSVSVYIVDDNGMYHKEIYPDEKVTFAESDVAEVVINKQEINHKHMLQTWFWANRMPIDMETIESITIKVPAEAV